MSNFKSVRMLTLALLGLVTLSAAACTNTLDGAGQDIERAGEKVQDTAK